MTSDEYSGPPSESDYEAARRKLGNAKKLKTLAAEYIREQAHKLGFSPAQESERDMPGYLADVISDYLYDDTSFAEAEIESYERADYRAYVSQNRTHSGNC